MKVNNPFYINLVLESFKQSNNIYGANRISIDIFNRFGIRISESSVQRIMKNNNLIASFPKTKNKYKENKNTKFKCDNLLNNETLKKYAPNEIGCADFSIIKIKNEHYHLFTIIGQLPQKFYFMNLINIKQLI